MLTREILKVNGRSLVECYEKGDFGKETTKKFVVCRDYDPGKRFGTQWIGGEYYDIWGNNDRESMLKAAMKSILGIKPQPIPYERLSEIATLIKDGLIEDDEGSAIEYLLNIVEITESEAEYFGLKDLLYPKRYKVVRCEVTETRIATVSVIMPEDEGDGNVYDYIDEYSLNDISDWEWEHDDYEYSVTHTIASELTESEAMLRDDAINIDDFAD